MKKAAVFFIPLVFISACDKAEKETVYGYVEADYVYVSPVSSGVLEGLFVEKGWSVKTGDALFAVGAKTLEADVAVASLAIDRARAQFANAGKGMRSEEIQVILRQREQAQAALVNAEKDWKRSKELLEEGNVSKAAVDAKTAVYDAAKARVAEIDASLKTAALGAREDEIKAAGLDIDTAEKSLFKAKRRLAESSPTASVGGRVEDVFYRLGETVPAGLPVVKLLPEENIKVRFFVSQKALPRVKAGSGIKIQCDGCKTLIPAKVTFISSQAEFTPPVIFSVESRRKLVFMVEAKPVEFAPELQIGLPVSVVLGQ